MRVECPIEGQDTGDAVVHHDGHVEGVSSRRGDAPIQHTVRGLVNVRRGVMRMPPLVDCTEIAVRAIVLVGEQDEPFRGSSEYMAVKIPEASGPIVVAGASHWANYDDPATWNAAVAEFLDGLPD